VNDRTKDILDRLMKWSMPTGTREQLAKLDQLHAEVCLLCGADKVMDLPTEPNLRREKLIDVVEAYLETGTAANG